VTARGEFLTELTLTVLEAKTRHLVRCHKQFLVNIRQIDEIVRQDPGSALLKTRSGRQVPVSAVLVHLKELWGSRTRLRIDPCPRLSPESFSGNVPTFRSSSLQSDHPRKKRRAEVPVGAGRVIERQYRPFNRSSGPRLQEAP